MKLHLFGLVITICKPSKENEAITPEKIYASKGKKAFEAKPPEEVSNLKRDINTYGEVGGWLLTDAEERAAKAQQWWDKSMQAAKERSVLPRLVQALKEEREAIGGYQHQEEGVASEVQGGHEDK